MKFGSKSPDTDEVIFKIQSTTSSDWTSSLFFYVKLFLLDICNRVASRDSQCKLKNLYFPALISYLSKIRIKAKEQSKTRSVERNNQFQNEILYCFVRNFSTSIGA